MDSTPGTIFAQAASFCSTTLRPIFRASAIDPQVTNTIRCCLALIVSPSVIYYVVNVRRVLLPRIFIFMYDAHPSTIPGHGRLSHQVWNLRLARPDRGRLHVRYRSPGGDRYRGPY